MSRLRFFAELFRRLRTKIVEIIPVIIGASVLMVGVLVLMYIVQPFLPEQVQQLFQQLRNGDWTSSQATFSRIFDGYGAAKPYAFLALQVLQVLFSPIPGQLVGLLGGYLFGFGYGLLLTMVGLGIGSWIAMGIGRLLGQRVVRRLIPQTVLARFDFLIAKGGPSNFFMIFLLPMFPDDAICLIAGLTRLRLWKLVLVCLLGRLPGMAILSFVGASVGGTMLLVNITLTVTIIAAFVLWLYSEEVEAFLHRLVKRNVPRPGESK